MQFRQPPEFISVLSCGGADYVPEALYVANISHSVPKLHGAKSQASTQFEHLVGGSLPDPALLQPGGPGNLALIYRS
jgi:hypothetical protein